MSGDSQGAEKRKSNAPASRVPNVITNVNSHEEQRLRLSLAQLEQQRVRQAGTEESWLRAFALRQTLRTQRLHRLGYTRSLEMLPDSLLMDYGDSLIGIAQQPLLGRIEALAQQQKRLKQERDGVRRSVSLGTDSLAEGDETARTSLSNHWLPDIHATANLTASDQSHARNLATQPPAQPISVQCQQQQRVHIISPSSRLPQLDPRFLQLVGSLERKSAWKRKYIPPKASRASGAGGATVGNSLEELVNSYYSK